MLRRIERGRGETEGVSNTTISGPGGGDEARVFNCTREVHLMGLSVVEYRLVDTRVQITRHRKGWDLEEGMRRRMDFSQGRGAED